MKRKFILIPSLLAVLLILLSFEGCKRNDGVNDGKLVGSWHSEMSGEYDDVITTDLIIRDNGEATFTWESSDEDDASESINCNWKVDGKELVFTSSDWEGEELRHEYEIAGNELILDPNDNCYFEFTKK